MRRFEFNTRRRRILRLLGILRGRPFLGPQVVTLEVTHHCNLRCSFCESHGNRQALPITSRREYEGGRRTMDLERIARLARDLAAVGTDLVELSGKGDPIAHPQLASIIRAVKGAGLSCSLFTNGTLARPGLARAIVDSGLDRLILSLNAGSRPVYAVTCGKDLWDRAVAFLEEVLTVRDSGKKRLPWIRLGHVIEKENVVDLDRMVQMAIDYKADEISLCVMSELPETLDLQIDPEQALEVRSRIPEWRTRLERAGVAHTLNLFDADLQLRVVEGRGRLQENPLQRQLPCYDGWMFASIAPDGAVSPCCYCEEVVAGNIEEGGFKKVWFGNGYEKIRNRMRAMPATGEPVCGECFTTCNRAVENHRIHRRLHPLGSGPRLPEPVELDPLPGVAADRVE